MEQKQILTNEQQRRNVVKKMWLNYFNNGLPEKGMITPDQHRRMKVYISGCSHDQILHCVMNSSIMKSFPPFPSLSIHT